MNVYKRGTQKIIVCHMIKGHKLFCTYSINVTLDVDVHSKRCHQSCHIPNKRIMNSVQLCRTESITLEKVPKIITSD